MTDANRTPLILSCGISRDANQRLADRLGGDGTAVVHHDLRQISSGVVLRTVKIGSRESSTTLELAHGCVSCTLREDLLPLLCELAGRQDVARIVVQLDETMEPERVSWAMDNVLVGEGVVTDVAEIQAIVATFDEGTWFEDASGNETLAERGLLGAPGDQRTLAQVALAQVEFADVLVAAGRATDTWTAAKTAAVLRRVAPSAVTLELSTVDERTLLDAVQATARRGEIDDPHGSLLRGEPPLHADCGITVVPFSARRPFHPMRLYDALDVLLEGVIRTRGRVWIASQPDIALWIESAGGGLNIGYLGAWLGAADGPGWDDVSPERRAFASLRWDPVFADRDQEFVVVAHDAYSHDIEEALRDALLTDEELADGPEAWAHYPDPFVREPDDAAESAGEISASNTGGFDN
ncbi:ribosome hibernation factor-recruiting GTPase MRF [Actinoalloteichus hymeniacidonis]|uniref:GTPase, G3E family n=1 Tax=Actinoalloteichus hymeniacidonis TaxID=340345 RepID=A0AAC9HMI9_9PSEU|nr:GTP-binding protein [Actinoalloteichus hymeniacidonis]AOS61869.1 putative GTPase, G3E family [Actinoalloteichus hymeniacidonis]MBB5910111.1 G3E family GTPase [Actinoalloteichus hymeniacidonis]